jgi:acetyl esterase/lipase
VPENMRKIVFTNNRSLISAINYFKVITFIICAAFFYSCKRDKEILPLKAIYLPDISYGANDLNKCDIYLPALRNAQTPVILLIHGGSWLEGNKQDTRGLAEIFSENKFAVVNINYQLANDSINFESINEDINKAIDFIRSKSVEFYVAKDKLILMGHSAGGHLALLTAFKNDPNRNVKAVVSLAGPTNLGNSFYLNGNIASGLATYIGDSYINQPQKYYLNSPINYVDASGPPVYILHGSNDLFIDINDSRQLAGKLDSLGVECKLHESNLSHEELLFLKKQDYTPMIDWMSKMMK